MAKDLVFGIDIGGQSAKYGIVTVVAEKGFCLVINSYKVIPAS